jgi:hypothetical protein
VRLLVHNGLGVYATWSLLAVVLNMAVWLKYSLGIDELLTGTIGLTIFALFMLSHFICDNYLYKRYLLWLITPSFVYLLAFISIVQGNWRNEKSTRNNVYSIALLGISIVFAAIKVLNVLVGEISEIKMKKKKRNESKRRSESEYMPVEIKERQ